MWIQCGKVGRFSTLFRVSRGVYEISTGNAQVIHTVFGGDVNILWITFLLSLLISTLLAYSGKALYFVSKSWIVLYSFLNKLTGVDYGAVISSTEM